MAKRQKIWVYSPPKQPKTEVPNVLREEVQSRANKLVQSVLIPEHVAPPPKDKRFNYLVDIYSKWRGSYFYFCSKYCCPGPNAISPFFEAKFARLEYVGNNCFNLSYMRHTGQWLEIYPGLSLDECFSAIRDESHFLP